MSATVPPERISFNAWKTILILCGTIVLFVYLNTGMGATITSIAEHFEIPETFASWVMTAYMICRVCHDCDNGTVIGPCWGQKNANGDDNMFYRRNYPGTFFS